MRGNARSRLARLEARAGTRSLHDCPDCVQICILDWRVGEPEPAPVCPRCGRAVPCIIAVHPVGPEGPEVCS
jgi:hypothetical protein